MRKLGKSKIKKRIYVDVVDVDITTYQDKGYEIIELGDVPRYYALRSAYGTCSGPSEYSARHCFGNPFHNVKNKEYEIVGSGEKGKVVKDYSPPLWNLFVQLARFFGSGYGVRDVVRVSTPLFPSERQIAVVTGGVINRPIALFTNVPTVEPEHVVDRDVVVKVDMPETDEIRCSIFDYAVMDIYLDGASWPHEVLVARCIKPLKPGNSGGPVYLLQ